MERMNITGWNIRRIRISKGMTVHQLASALPPPVILCAGEVAEVELQTRILYDFELLAICQALGVSIESLYSTPQKNVKNARK